MAFQLSPGVRVREIDLTNIIPAVSTSIGGFAGFFRWGPIEQIITVSSERELVQYFGTPDNNVLHASSFFTASSFLKYSQALRVVRAGGSEDSADEGYTNAVDIQYQNFDTAGAPDNISVPVLIRNKDEFDNRSVNNFSVAARYAGALGNSIGVAILTNKNWNDTAAGVLNYKNEFDSRPNIDEVHVLVVDEDGAISGVVGSILEKWSFLSRTEGAKTADGTLNYYIDVINERSNYIYFGDLIDDDLSNDTADGADTAGSYENLFYSLSGGRDLTTTDVADSISGLHDALDLFNDPETVDIDLLFSISDWNGWTSANGKDDVGVKLFEIAESRKDLVAFISPPRNITTPYQDNDTDLTAASITNNLISWAGNYSSSYVVLDSGALYVYDKYNDRYRWIPASGHMAGLCANTDEVADPWYSPAGLNRGVIRGVIKVAYNPNKTRRDDLYKIGINPIVSFTGQGIVLFGDKTSLSRPSAFDRINVRRLFLVLEKAISTASRFQLFEFNDEFTRAQFRSLVEPFLREVQGRRGITDFLVVCDESNNTGDVIDRNEFVADIYIKPARSINYITLNFVATRTGADFNEIIGLTSANALI